MSTQTIAMMRLFLMLGLDGDEAHEDVRHAEVPEAPDEAGDDRDERDPAGRVGEEVEVVGASEARDQLGGDARGGEGGGDRHDDERGEHQHPLDEVGPAGGQKAAEEGVGDDDDRADGQRHDVVEVEDVLEKLRAGAEGGSGVDEEKDEDDHCADASDRGGLAAKAVLQILRDGDRVVGDVGELAQAHGDELPVEIGAEREADGDPRGGEPRPEGRGGKPEQQPAGHVGGLRAQRGDPAPEAPASEEIVGDVVGLAVEIEADPHHQGEIDDECDQDADVKLHGGSSSFSCLDVGWGAFAHCRSDELQNLPIIIQNSPIQCKGGFQKLQNFC